MKRNFYFIVLVSSMLFLTLNNVFAARSAKMKICNYTKKYTMSYMTEQSGSSRFHLRHNNHEGEDLKPGQCDTDIVYGIDTPDKPTGTIHGTLSIYFTVWRPNGLAYSVGYVKIHAGAHTGNYHDYGWVSHEYLTTFYNLNDIGLEPKDIKSTNVLGVLNLDNAYNFSSDVSPTKIDKHLDRDHDAQLIVYFGSLQNMPKL